LTGVLPPRPLASSWPGSIHHNHRDRPLDNGHYIRQDTLAVKRLFQLRRVVDQSFTIIIGVRLKQSTAKEAPQRILEGVPSAQDTFATPRTLYPPAEDQLIEPILFELFRGQYAMPSDELILRAADYIDDLKKAVARNWMRIDVLAMRIDEKLRKVDPRPRTQNQPGALTYQMLREILNEMLPKS
jgi:hypothetical protein